MEEQEYRKERSYKSKTKPQECKHQILELCVQHLELLMESSVVQRAYVAPSLLLHYQ